MSDVVLDANVLVPKYTRWTLLWVSTTVPVFNPRWSKRILQETYTNLVLRDLDTAEGIRALHALLREHFPSAWIDQDAIDDNLTAMTNDRKDRHVLAAAALVGAPTIVTRNLGDFPAAACAPHGVTATTADDYLTALAVDWPDEVEEALGAYTAVMQQPQPWTFAELLGAIGDPKRLPKFAAQVSADSGIEPDAPPT